MADEGDGENPFLKHREELLKKAQDERKKIDTAAKEAAARAAKEAAAKAAKAAKEAKAERKRLAKLRKQNLIDAKKYLINDVEEVMVNISNDPLILEKAGSKSFFSEAFENLRDKSKPLFDRNVPMIVTFDRKAKKIAFRIAGTNNKSLHLTIPSMLVKRPTSIDISDDNQFIAIADVNKTLILNAVTGEQINIIQGSGSPIAFLPKTHVIVVFRRYKHILFKEKYDCVFACAYTGKVINKIELEGRPNLINVAWNDRVYFTSKTKVNDTTQYHLNCIKITDPKGSLLTKHSVELAENIPFTDINSASSKNLFGYINKELGLYIVDRSEGGENSRFSHLRGDNYDWNGEIIRHNSFSFSPNAKNVVSSLDNGNICIYDLATEKSIKSTKIDGIPKKVQYSYCGKFIVIFTDKFAQIRDSSSLELVVTIRIKDRSRDIFVLSKISMFNDGDLESIFQDVRRMSNSADFFLSTKDGSNFTLSWNGIIE